MYGLTDAEARVVWSALALPGAAERARLDGSGLASSTYHAARRRSYAEGWLRDRYVPDPVAFGYPVATFILGRPYAEQIHAVGRRWAATDGAALIWTGTPMALGVFFHPTVPAAHRAMERLQAVLPLRDVSTLTVDLAEHRIPVYFDYEGAWARIAGIPVSPSYPAGLGYGAGVSMEDAAPRRPVPDRYRATALELMERPFAASPPGVIRLLGFGGLDRRQRDLLDGGYLRPRSFLDPSAVPEYRGRQIDQVFLVTGEMRDRTEPTAVLSELRASYHASPFLFVADGAKVLVGLVGHSGAPPPSAAGADAPSAPVGSILRDAVGRWMHRVDLYREEAATLRTVVDHRYGFMAAPRPVGPPAEPASVRARPRSPGR
ncbi:MAG TPA: hypothetical protein VMH90_07000 [Thermoplasmata archaeon]|nr:hypothetical protein [Thermoplasmata archaeon]